MSAQQGGLRWLKVVIRRTGTVSQRSTYSATEAGESAGPARKIWGWLDDRLGLSALRYKVPEHANTIWYTLGGITFVGIIVYATHLRKMVGYGLVLLAFAGVLSVLFPQPIGSAPDPTVEVTKPSPIYYGLYSFDDCFGVLGILYGAIALFGLLALVLFIDRTPLRSIRRRPVMLVFGVVLLIALAVLSYHRVQPRRITHGRLGTAK